MYINKKKSYRAKKKKKNICPASQLLSSALWSHHLPQQKGKNIFHIVSKQFRHIILPPQLNNSGLRQRCAPPPHAHLQKARFSPSPRLQPQPQQLQHLQAQTQHVLPGWLDFTSSCAKSSPLRWGRRRWRCASATSNLLNAAAGIKSHGKGSAERRRTYSAGLRDVARVHR